MARGIILVALLFAGAFGATAQQSASPAPRPDQVLAAEPEHGKDVNVVYGRIKELKGGQKIVIHVDNAKDKTYNLADRDRAVTVAEALAVGDPVKVIEAKTTKAVQIVRDTGREQTKSREKAAQK